MKRRIELLRKDLADKIHELLLVRCPFWKRAEFSNSSVTCSLFYQDTDLISIETLCDFLDALDGKIPLRLLS